MQPNQPPSAWDGRRVSRLRSLTLDGSTVGTASFPATMPVHALTGRASFARGHGSGTSCQPQASRTIW